MYQPPRYQSLRRKTPQQKRRDLWIALGIIIGLLLLMVLMAHTQRATPDSTFTVVTPDDGDTSYTGGTGSSTSWVYGHGSPLPTMAPTTTFHYGVNHNPWGYDFDSTGKLLYSPVPGFCAGQYFNCVSTFWEDSGGYVVECHNELYSHSGGVQGACSRDGGVWRPLYSH